MFINKKSISAFAVTVILSTVLLPTIASAQENGQRRGPPPEAFEACANQAEAAACSFSGNRGDVTGTCMMPPQGESELICAPEGGRPEGGRPEKQDN